jgi:5-methylcytosine-specific restriction enzyme B
VPDRWEIDAQTLFIAARVLAQHPEGVRRRDLWPLVLEQSSDVGSEWAVIITGETTAERNFSFSSINLVKAGWLRKTRGTWFLTPVGRVALDALQDATAFYSRSVELYSEWERNRTRYGMAARLIESIPEGTWVAATDVAAETELSPVRLVEWLQADRGEGWHRVLDGDGGLPDQLSLTDQERAEWAALLEQDGVVMILDRADSGARILGSDLAHLVYEEDTVEGAARRAWLIRGSSVQGTNLVRALWLPQGVCSLPASRLRELPPGAPQDLVRAAVDSDYAYATVQQRARMTAEYYAFLSRMRANDIIITNDGTDVFLGVLTGEPAWELSQDNRANLQRSVDWRNASHPLDFAAMPDEIAARVSNPDADLIDLTEFTVDLEQYLGDKVDQPPTDREVRLPDITEEFADRLYMPQSLEWLQECVELLRDHPQLIFYGPPGTGKTHLAQELASYLTGRKPENVQLVQFHPAYSYEDFIEGYRPREGDNGTVAFRLTDGPLRLLVNAAIKRPAEPHVLIVDEINRANLAKVFGELYFLLEYRHKAVNLLYGSDKGQGFNLPRNLIILGTMNSSDRSIALVDMAMRRRFWFQELHPDVPPVQGLLETWLAKNEYPPDAALLLGKLNEKITDRDFKIGPSYLMRSAVQSPVGLSRVWRTQLLPLLEEHHYGELDHDEITARYGLDVLRRELNMPEPASTVASDQ